MFSSYQNLRKTFITLTTIVSFAVLTACSGGSDADSDSENNNNENPPPSGNATPSISITAPATESTFSDQATIAFSADADDDEDGDLSSSIEWSSNLDGNLGSGASISTRLSAGSHTITASVTDFGNKSASTSIELTITESVTNSAPAIEITSPEADSSFNDETTITFSATATDPEDGNLSESLEWSSNLDGVLGYGSEITAVLSAGEHTISVSVTDSEGETSVETIQLEILATYGNASLSWSIPTTNTDGSDLEDLAGFVIYYGNSVESMDQTIEVDNANAGNYLIENLTVNQTYYFAVAAKNTAGIESERSDVVSKAISG